MRYLQVDSCTTAKHLTYASSGVPYASLRLAAICETNHQPAPPQIEGSSTADDSTLSLAPLLPHRQDLATSTPKISLTTLLESMHVL